MVQWASQTAFRSATTCWGLDMNGTAPVSACIHIIVTVEGTSPSQPAIWPSSMSCDSAMHPVVARSVTRSKQRTVHAPSE